MNRISAATLGERSPERRLADEAAAGNQEALTAIFNAHRREVYRVARAVTGDHESALDAVQDTFIKVFQSLAAWREAAALRTWIVRIAVRTAIDQNRRSRRASAGTYPAPEPSHDPRRTLERTLLLDKVRQLAEGMNGQPGVILRLRLLADLSNREIAESLGLSEPNVRMHLSRAVRRLREQL